MRRKARADANQPDIVEALRAVGASVAHIHMVGQGLPDIIVGFHGVNYLMEIKDGGKPPSKRRLTPNEQDWHDAWRGSVVVVNDEDQALRAIGAID